MAYNTSLGHSNTPTTYGSPATLLPSSEGSQVSPASLAWPAVRNGTSASDGLPGQATHISLLPTKRSDDDELSGAGIVCDILSLPAPGPADKELRTAVDPLLGVGSWDGTKRELFRAALLNWSQHADNASTLPSNDWDQVKATTQQTRADLGLGHDSAKEFQQDVKRNCGPDTSAASSRGIGMSYGAAAVAALALAGTAFVN